MSEQNLSVRKWSASDFDAGKEHWQKLLDASTSDKLFLSWSWMNEWWNIWGKGGQHELCIFAAYQQTDLVGIAPMYLSRDRLIKGKLAVNRLQFIGSRYRGGSGIRAECLEFIVKPDTKEKIAEALMQSIVQDKSWGELILSDLVVNSDTYFAVKQNVSGTNYYVRHDRTEVTYEVACEGTFEEYLSQLGKNTRLKFYNRRKLLETHGTVTVENAAVEDINEVFDAMNDFHLRRWSSTAFGDVHKKILRKAMADFPTGRDATYSSILKVNGEPVSAMLNLYANNKIYNIQLGFLEDFDKKISLGTLHLGYAIEAAFQDQQVKSFDLLAGSGKNSNYKDRLAKPTVELESSQIIRSHVSKLLYLFNDKIMRKLKK